MAKKKFQRVSKEDAHKILDNLIGKDKDKFNNPINYSEDSAGGTTEYVRIDVVEKLISKITR